MEEWYEHKVENLLLNDQQEGLKFPVHFDKPMTKRMYKRRFKNKSKCFHYMFTLKLLLFIHGTSPSINRPMSSHFRVFSGEAKNVMMSSPIKIFFLTSVVPSSVKNKSNDIAVFKKSIQVY